MAEFITFGSSVIAAFIAAFVTHYLATSRMKENDLSKYQVEAYSDFIAAASRLAVSRRLGDSKNENVDLGALNDAKSRIITSGHLDVVKALIHFWEQGATLEREQEILAYKNLTQIMRSSLGHKKNDIFDLKISDALFKLEPSSFSYRANRAANKSSQQDAAKLRR
jgi:hypothetical protein